MATAPSSIKVMTTPGMVAMKNIQGNTKRYQTSSGIISGSLIGLRQFQDRTISSKAFHYQSCQKKSYTLECQMQVERIGSVQVRQGSEHAVNNTAKLQGFSVTGFCFSVSLCFSGMKVQLPGVRKILFGEAGALSCS